MSAQPKVVQVQYHASPTGRLFHHSKAFVRGIRGPIGSGKSTACCFELFNIACTQKPDAFGVRRTRMVIVRNTMPELKSTTIKTWLDWFPEGDPRKDKTKFGVFSRQSPYTHFVKYGMPDGTLVDMEVIFLALDQEQDVKKLLSLECTAIWYNEARELHKDIIDAGTGRVGRYPSMKSGGCTRKAIIMDTNSPDEEHWWASLEENPPEGWDFYVQPSGLAPDAENLEWLDQGSWERLFPGREQKSLTLEERRQVGRLYYTDMLGGKEESWINVYVRNLFGTIEKGVPVYKATWNSDIHLAKAPIIIVPRSTITVGIDCSGRHPALVYLQHTGTGRFQVVRELCIMDKQGMGAEKFARYFVEDLNRHFPGNNLDQIWGDPAGDNPSQNDERTYFQILNDELRAYELKAKPSPGLRWPERHSAVEEMLSTLVEARPMLEISPECKVLTQGFQGKYMFKEINTAGGGSRVDDRPVKNRHSNPHDALQYAACGLRGYRGRFARPRGPAKVHVVRTKGSVFR